jgi:hypothetical protein
LATVVVVAAADTVRNRGAEPPPAATTELDGRNELTERLEALGAHGELLLYGDGCSLEVLELPSLERRDHESTCSPRGAVSPDGRLVAACPGDETRIFYTADGGLYNGVPGCSPAWRPDGSLTVAHERAVVRFGACPGPDACPVTLIARSELERAARRHPTVPDVPVRLRVLIDGIAWLSQTRAAVLLSIRIGGRLAGMGALSEIVFFEKGRLAPAARTYIRGTGGRLAASSRGTYVTQTPDVILRGDGSEVSLPQYLRNAHAFAWSKDERFLALATRFAVTVLDVASLERYDDAGAGLRSVTLPLRVTELVWR